MLLDAWQIDFEGCAVTQLARHHDVTAALLDDSINSGQSQTSAASGIFRSEERLEDAGLGLRIHADTAVGDGQKHVTAGLSRYASSGVGLVEMRLGNR